jgi:hypothetical protein
MAHSLRTIRMWGLPAKVGTTWTPGPWDKTASTSSCNDGRAGGGSSLFGEGFTVRRGAFLRAGLQRELMVVAGWRLVGRVALPGTPLRQLQRNHGRGRGLFFRLALRPLTAPGPSASGGCEGLGSMAATSEGEVM